jgi:oxygen-independent coproporphyrinogen-3 oxidase
MSNLYVHYPFCKQACHYCNFHFSTSSKGRPAFFSLLRKELELRKEEIQYPLESLYFGGGSPSLIPPKEIGSFITYVVRHFDVYDSLEITLEVNPDDVNENYLKEIKSIGVNRLSIGIQSFFEEELKMMHRAHDVDQAHKALATAIKHFDNFSLDLIYGMPYSTLERWEENLKTALAYQPPHLSAYALTVEKKTVLKHLIKENKVSLIEEEAVKDQYDFLINEMEALGYVNYEFSNFGKAGFFSVNNLNYWNGKPYIGLGPSAHSYDGHSKRSWNVSNNHRYASGVREGKLAYQSEQLNLKERYNEYLMTGLRKSEGVSLMHVKKVFGEPFTSYLEEQAGRQLDQRNLYWDGDQLKVSKESKFLTDGIAADLFLV